MDSPAQHAVLPKRLSTTAAQNALLELEASGAAADPGARAAFPRRHGKTRVGQYAAGPGR